MSESNIEGVARVAQSRALSVREGGGESLRGTCRRAIELRNVLGWVPMLS